MVEEEKARKKVLHSSPQRLRKKQPSKMKIEEN